MSKLKWILPALCLGLGLAHAIPVYYFFQGEVVASNVSSNPIGSSVQYVYLVDFSRIGFVDFDYGGEPQTEKIPHYFYAEYIKGDALTSDAGGPYFFDYHYAYSMRKPTFNRSGIVGSNRDLTGNDFVAMESWSMLFNEWKIGQSDFRGLNFVIGMTPQGYATIDSVVSRVTLVSITETNPLNPIPEPSTIALSLLGLVFIGFKLKRRTA